MVTQRDAEGTQNFTEVFLSGSLCLLRALRAAKNYYNLNEVLSIRCITFDMNFKKY